ncbi:uncharacterized protein LOC141649465 [Silene latifolia]|uniref:uncharacterized protein LOC141649465 n=1 Tax=Silene latifolia TaxID=37657 RepID=UPI003D7877AE
MARNSSNKTKSKHARRIPALKSAGKQVKQKQNVKQRSPADDEVVKTKSTQEVNGIPGLNFDDDLEVTYVADTPEVAEVADTPEVVEVENSLWITQRGKKKVIHEDEEEHDEGLLQFSKEDTQDEVEYWNNAIYCFFLEANSPWEILNGFLRRIWSKHSIDKVSFMPNGIVMVRFKEAKDKEEVLNAGHFMFDNKPPIVRAWTAEVELTKENIKDVPAWIRIHDLPLRFWGKCLPAIAGLVGTYQKSDQATMDKTRLGYARVMVKLTVGNKFPSKVRFRDEIGSIVSLPVEYEWKPSFCIKYKGIGHEAANCRKEMKPQKKHVHTLQVWRPVKAAGLIGIPDKSTKISSLVRSSQQIANGQGVSANLVTPEKSYIEARWFSHTKGGRVWLMWKADLYDVHVLKYDAQFVHALVTERCSLAQFYITMVYAFNDGSERRNLWMKLELLHSAITGPWWLLEGQIRVYSRLDRFLINQDWAQQFPNMAPHFHPSGYFDHCPCVVSDNQLAVIRKTNFKYFNMWSKAHSLLTTVQEEWQKCYSGYPMYCVTSKLKALKGRLKELNKECYSDVENSAILAEKEVINIQGKLIQDPLNAELIQEEITGLKSFKELNDARQSYLRQKAKAQWMEDEDANSTYFHGAIKKRCSMNKVTQIEYYNGHNCTTSQSIRDAFLNYYQELLGTSKPTEMVRQQVLNSGKCCTEAHKEILNKPVTNEEIKEAFFKVPIDKSPGPDGYTSGFFKDSWDIVESDICSAIHDFFSTGKRLKQINATTITLIPKCERPTTVKQFRPIACCNLLYKVISKLLCNRLSVVLPDLVSENQGALIEGRSIIENVLICQDIVKMYNRQAVSPRCLFKIDLQKAYDTVEWSFVAQLLDGMGFPSDFSQKVMSCIQTTSYSLNLNGIFFGFFRGKRGLRQGDPISPLIFALCMDYLTRMLQFGNVQSIMLMMRAFSSFSKAYGLFMNISKSEVTGFTEGSMPFRYLEVPIQATRLTKIECNILVEKMVNRIRSLGAKKLSYAGRLVLVNSVLNTLHNYWSGIFLIPKCVVKRIEAVCRNYLWDGSADYHRVPSVGWDKVTLPKEEGGLGIKRTAIWNIASVAKLVDWLYCKADRLWISWVNKVHIKGRNWHDYHPPADVAWSWKNVCKVKELIKAAYVEDQ